MFKTALAKIVTPIFLVFALSSAVAFADDTVIPDVEVLEATALDGAIELRWDAPADDSDITGYAIYYGENSVQESGESYDRSISLVNLSKVKRLVS